MTPNEAAGHALKLLSLDAKLCERHPSKIARTSSTKSNITDKDKMKKCTVPSNESVVSESSKNVYKSCVKYNSGKFLIYI